jgi:hypothetical protein
MNAAAIRAAAIVATVSAAICSAQAEAGAPDDVCRAIADQANGDGRRIGERDIYAASDAITAILPKSMRYLKPKPVKSADIGDLLGCHGQDCVDGQDELADDDDSVWSKLLVDTRPSSRQVFLYTEHSGHDRIDSLIAIEQASDGGWVRTFQSSDALDDSGFRILLYGKRPYVVIPPGPAFFVDIGTDAKATELYLTVEDPSPDQAHRCMVAYSLVSRLTVSDDSQLRQIVPEGNLQRAVARFLDRNIAVIVQQTSFEEKGSRVLADHAFVEPGTAMSEIEDLDRFLAAPPSFSIRADAVRGIVRRVMADDWESIDENIQPDDWKSRWFPIGIGGHAYLGLLQGFSASFPTRGPHFFNESLVALFALEGNGLRPIAAYELQKVFRFSGARFEPLSDGMLP